MKRTTHTPCLPMIKGLLTAGAVVVLMAATQASALTLTNRDASMYDVAVTENDTTATVQVQPAQTLENICKQGCTIALESGATQAFDGSETVAIENGQFTVTE